MATWAEFAAGDLGRAEIADGQWGGGHAPWRDWPGGAAEMAEAGRRLFARAGGQEALLGTVSAKGRPRIHPFIPQVVDGRLWAFVGAHSPKRRDLDRSGQYTIHSMQAPEDEEFWVAGHARAEPDADLRARIAAAMPYPVALEHEALYEFDVELAVWTRWLDFATPRHRPLHHRWTGGD
jgi:hypothetical protein